MKFAATAVLASTLGLSGAHAATGTNPHFSLGEIDVFILNFFDFGAPSNVHIFSFAGKPVVSTTGADSLLGAPVTMEATGVQNSGLPVSFDLFDMTVAIDGQSLGLGFENTLFTEDMLMVDLTVESLPTEPDTIDLDVFNILAPFDFLGSFEDPFAPDAPRLRMTMDFTETLPTKFFEVVADVNGVPTVVDGFDYFEGTVTAEVSFEALNAPLAVVPVPLGAPLLLAGLGAMGVLSRRKRHDSGPRQT